MRKHLLAIGAVALVLGFVGCSDLVVGSGEFDGEYNLETLNGLVLPTVVYEDAFERDELLSERFRIYAEGSYTDDYTLRISSGSGQRTESYRDTGTYTRYGTQLQFDGSTGDTFTGEVNGRTLTISQNGNLYVYRR